MKKIISSVFLFCFSVISIFAQNSFTLPEASAPAIDNSLYNSVAFLDSRPEQHNSNTLINGVDFARKLSLFLRNTTNANAKEGVLLLQLRELNISNTTDLYKSRLQANLFDKQDDDYYFIDSIDVDVDGTSVSDLEIKLSDQIYSFLDENLTQEVTDKHAYSLDDLYNFDLVEKMKKPLYGNNQLADGIYVSFEDFKNQYPLDDLVMVDYKKDGEVKEVKATNVELDKTIKVNPTDVYAIVFDGEAYVSFDNKFIPLYKENNDLFFQYKATQNLSRANLPVVGVGYNLNGSLNNVVYKIDDINGDIYPVGIIR